MKKPENSLYPPDWLKVAKKDWHRMKIMLDEEDAEAAGYFLQQSLEKYLKAFLLEKGWKLQKIHELDALLDEAVKHNEDLESYRDLCERVSGYYFTDRYPALVDTGLTCEDIEKDVEKAKRFIKTLAGARI
ncbi:MAG: HEPN domain-containing protein [candidate division Zixibacteria bacterium]|nr:HEPN domain-containing protein [candidate division Zixibacteria bacterium]